jgi:spermidine/putrescine transport system substrate-binding protein
MKRRAFLGAAAGAGYSAACHLDHRPRLNVFNWSSYIDPKSVEAFSAQYGVRVRYGVYESNEEMLAKVMTGNSGWDVVFPTHSRIPPMVRQGLIAPLDHRLLPGLHHLDPVFQKPAWDSSLRWCVPYMWNATGITYSSALQPAPVAWADLWSDRVRGRLTMLDDPEDVIGACLLKLGLSFDTTSREHLMAARAQAIAEKKYLRAYLNAEVRDQLVAGDVLAAQLWSTTAQQAISAEQKSHTLGFCYPREGFPLYCDNAVILAESRRRELAHRFLDFLLRPEIAAANATIGETATANRDGRMMLPADTRDSTVLYPAGEVMHRGIWPVAPPPDVQRLRDRIWTEIKSA